MKAASSLSLTLLLGALSMAAQSAATSPAPLAAGWQARLAAMLPLPGETVKLMQRQPSLAIVDLRFRVESVQGSRSALDKVLADYQNGVQPTYDERLGISREEFKRYLVLQEELVASSKTVKLPLTRDSSRITFGDAPGLGGVLKGVSIDLKTGEMRGPEGYTARPINVAPTTPTTSVGGRLPIRFGLQWKIKGSDARVGNGINGTLNLLLLDDERIILSYKRVSMIARKISDDEIIISYDH